MKLKFKIQLFCVEAGTKMALSILWVLKMLIYALAFAIPASLVLGFYWLAGGNFDRSLPLAFSLVCAVCAGSYALNATLTNPIPAKDVNDTEYL